MSSFFVQSGFNTKASRLRSWVSQCNQVFNLMDALLWWLISWWMIQQNWRQKQNQSRANHKWLWSWTMHISKDTRLRRWVSPCNQVFNLSEQIGLHRTFVENVMLTDKAMNEWQEKNSYKIRVDWNCSNGHRFCTDTIQNTLNNIWNQLKVISTQKKHNK